MAAVHGTQPLRLDVGVDLCRPDVGVPEQCLDDAQIRTAVQEVRGEAVSKRVR